ncbi:MAG: hypothetical protein E5W81_04240 [Mesorhizobium sp.]|nr:MAG: hypothetical protein E5V36_00600 [Mesorhizobium sp.]TKB96434.1 MAG: hypothetical protein E5W81_04240 [Mesorhizobium sp.]
MANVIDEPTEAGPFGFFSGNRSSGISQWPKFDALSAADKRLVEDVQKAQRRFALIKISEGSALVVHEPFGFATPETDNVLWGYKVFEFPAPQPALSTAKRSRSGLIHGLLGLATGLVVSQALTLYFIGNRLDPINDLGRLAAIENNTNPTTVSKLLEEALIQSPVLKADKTDPKTISKLLADALTEHPVLTGIAENTSANAIKSVIKADLADLANEGDPAFFEIVRKLKKGCVDKWKTC